MTSRLLDLLPLPDKPRMMLEPSPLVLALCQIRFGSVLAVADPAVVAPFQRAIQRDYPIAESAQEVELQLEPQAQQVALRRSGPLWHFRDQEDNWRVVLAPDFVALEARAYRAFEDFLRRLDAVVAALLEHIAPQFGTRIGLRYVNELRPASPVWSAIIHRDLLGPLTTPELADGVAQTLQEVLMRFEQDQLRLRHGFLPQGTTVAPSPGREPDDRPFYLLDLDAFREFPPPQTLSLSPAAIREYVTVFHQAIYRLFRWSVVDEYLITLCERAP